jgi:hypothetical protein
MATSTAAPKRHRYPPLNPNRLKLFDCLHPTCHKKGEKGSPNTQACMQHMKQAHGWGGKEASEAYAAAQQPASPPPAAPTEQPTNGNHPIEKRKPGRKPAAVMGATKYLNIPFTRNERVNTQTNEQATIDECLNYCPRCNSDLEKIKQLTGGVGPSRCPDCKLNLASVRMALAPDLITLAPDQVANVFGVMLRIVQGGN